MGEHETVRIGRISYINVAPVYYGLDRDMKPDWMTMVTEPPAVLNGMLERGEIVLSPVSSAAYAKNHENWLVMPDLSISCNGKVMSVILASRYPFDGLHGKRVFFTEESATAAALVRYFFAMNKISPVIETGRITDSKSVPGSADAALVIGDTALTQNWPARFSHVYDLGEMWKNRTGLPFVFAVWAVRRDFAESRGEILSSIKRLFLESKTKGETNREEIVRDASLKTGLSQALCRTYFDHLYCDLGPEFEEGLKAYFDGLYREKIIQEKVNIRFA
jgi:chorismate dehydratase